LGGGAGDPPLLGGGARDPPPEGGGALRGVYKGDVAAIRDEMG